ncbi:siderophore ABC transporter substrate-binding protein [Clostridium sp.]|uniref:siderophore ABC transporter substrate-binding protein n=1 Tax=Clostridium sp. TaxID=1506 RepID=UPI002FC700E9
MNKKIGIIVSVIVIAMIGAFGYSKFVEDKDVFGEEKETVLVTHRKGETKVPKNPERVVVLDFGSLDIMQTIGKKPIALPKSGLPSYLEEYKESKYEDLGTLKEFDMEKINELKPDLIIIEGRQEKFYDELNKIAPTIMLGTEGSDHFGSLDRNIKAIGAIYGEEGKLNEKIEGLNKRIEAVSKKVSSNKKTALVAMVNEGNISVYGQGSRFGTIYDKFGFTPADDNIEVSSHGQNVSYEYLASKNPDYLFVIDKGIVAGGNQKPAKDVIENELTKNTKAYKDGNIKYLNTQVWYLGGSGIMATEAMVEEIEKAI